MDAPTTTQDPADAPADKTLYMPLWQCHKRVFAFKITEVEPIINGGMKLIHSDCEGMPPISISNEWAARFKPAAGSYFITYMDGYQSVSPAKAFEEGYILADEWGTHVTQDPKFGIGEFGKHVNRRTGEAIPDDEPVMLFRARDKHALKALQAYRESVAAEGLTSVVASVDERINAFASFAVAFTLRMKNPT